MLYENPDIISIKLNLSHTAQTATLGIVRENMKHTLSPSVHCSFTPF